MSMVTIINFKSVLYQTNVSNALLNKQQLDVTDCAKAFDRVKHFILLEKYYRFSLLMFMRSYL